MILTGPRAPPLTTITPKYASRYASLRAVSMP
jgi:hypothetical protein